MVLFDFDGVLVISNHAHVKNIKETFDEESVPLDVDDTDITKHFGKHYKIVIHELLTENNRNEELKKRLGDRLKKKFEHQSFFESFEEIEGLNDFLLKLKKKGYVLGIASGNSHYILEKWVSMLGISEFFSLLIGVDDVKNGKPDPEMILKASAYFKVPVENIVYVGDTVNDVMMARNACAQPAVVLTGVMSRKDAEELSVNLVADDVTKLDL